MLVLFNIKWCSGITVRHWMVTSTEELYLLIQHYNYWCHLYSLKSHNDERTVLACEPMISATFVYYNRNVLKCRLRMLCRRLLHIDGLHVAKLMLLHIVSHKYCSNSARRAQHQIYKEEILLLNVQTTTVDNEYWVFAFALLSLLWIIVCSGNPVQSLEQIKRNLLSYLLITCLLL